MRISDWSSDVCSSDLVLLAWENEAFLARKEFGDDKFEIVVPSISVLAEPQVAVVDKVVDKKGTRKVAKAYLNYMYTDEAQEIIEKNEYRQSNAQHAAKYASPLPKPDLVTLSAFTSEAMHKGTESVKT